MVTIAKIEWTHSTWNPVTGCDKISDGCQHCYAERMARRLQAMGVANYRNGFDVTLHPEALLKPLSWKKPRLVFVGSMTDIFHKEIPLDFQKQIFSIMERTPQHIYQILTKRPGRMAKLATKLPWPDNVWMGTTVESARYLRRIDQLRRVPAITRWLSMEPLLGPTPELNLDGIHWVVVGGESGPGARPIHEEWILQILDHCRAQDVAFFFKQWGGLNKKKAGRLLQGRLYSEMPLILKREHPQVSLAL